MFIDIVADVLLRLSRIWSPIDIDRVIDVDGWCVGAVVVEVTFKLVIDVLGVMFVTE